MVDKSCLLCGVHTERVVFRSTHNGFSSHIEESLAYYLCDDHDLNPQTLEYIDKLLEVLYGEE